MTAYEKFLELMSQPHADYEMISGRLLGSYSEFSADEQRELNVLLRRLTRSKREAERAFARNLLADLETFLRSGQRKG